MAPLQCMQGCNEQKIVHVHWMEWGDLGINLVASDTWL